MFWVYILRCSDDSYYVGHTDDLERRLEQHRQGQVPCHTRGRLPVVLVYSQETTTREDALSAERRLKGWSRAKKEALVRGDWGSVRKLARGRHRPARR